MDGTLEGGRTTETTPFPSIDDNDNIAASPSQDAVERKNDKEKDVTPKKKPPHRRSLSGNLLKLLRTGSNDRVDQDGTSSDKNRGSAMAGAIADSQSRKRRGSLRKSVLGKGREKDRDRKGKSPLASPISPTAPTTFEPLSSQLSTPRPSLEVADDSASTSPEHPPAQPPPRWQAPFRTLSRVSIPSIRSSVPSVDPTSSATSVHNAATNLSTSSDDNDARPSAPFPTLRKIPTVSSIDTHISSSSSWIYPSVSASISTAPSLVGDTIRRSTNLGYFASAHALARSPLASAPQSVAGSPTHSDSDLDDDDEAHDYSLTAFWGYVILLVTWIVFVVGMGSCFGFWSWAWDVGETPYAPPELEDDASLPITGYYPALMVLTAIMAWLWVVVAWVGMKYFRHADFRGEDG